MKNKYVFIAMLLLALNIFLLFQNKVLVYTNGNMLQSYNNKFANDSLRIIHLQQLISGNYFISMDLPQSIKDCVKNGPKLFLFISEGNCGACIEENLIYLSDLENIIGTDKIIILGNFTNKKSFDNFISNSFIYKNNSLYCRDFNIPEIYKRQPILFVVDQQYNILLFFVPDFYPEYNEKYFTNIIPDYFRFVDLSN